MCVYRGGMTQLRCPALVAPPRANPSTCLSLALRLSLMRELGRNGQSALVRRIPRAPLEPAGTTHHLLGSIGMPSKDGHMPSETSSRCANRDCPSYPPGHLFPPDDASVPSELRQPCPECGLKARSIAIRIRAAVALEALSTLTVGPGADPDHPSRAVTYASDGGSISVNETSGLTKSGSGLTCLGSAQPTK